MYTVYVQQKRLLIVSVAALFVVLSGGVILLLRLSSKTAPSSPSSELSSGSAASQPSKTLKKYTDASGFSFKYPEDVSIAEQAGTDITTYSSLEFRSQGARGGLTMSIKDSPYASLDAWEKENKKLISGKGTPARLGDIAVKEYQTDGNLLAVGIDKNILFLVDADFKENESYWGSVYNSLLSSFSFSLPQSGQSSGDDASFGDEGAIEDEGEEIIE